MLSSLATVLLFFCFNFKIIEESDDFFNTFDKFRKETNYLYVSWGSLCILTAHFCWNTIREFGKSHKCYSQRISLNEYEYQKQTYTQIKINELLNSREYKEYLKNKGNLKLND